MKIIPLINEFTNTFNEIFQKNLNPLNLESKIREAGDMFTLKLYESFLNYIDDKFKHSKERFILLREILHLKPYQRLTNEAKYQLIKYSMDENMSQADRHALRNTIISRSTVSKKIKVLDGTIEENITRTNNQPDILYIEMVEIHVNLQHNGNKI